ncbi:MULTISPECIES: peroxiredoxin [Alphaproteobacteria]|uniref:thioredoxin-dependent peroxiredoxin n=2 Tax=Alphaproteobacteria TaxID=28211 RepID=A0A512HCX8_9HYPH|nr:MULTISPECIES: peroxiredoxin [Alphaproteobacteria]GEO83220.1 peroxiredoxin [Ciceribacter naphthalenivorans]GLR20385.1 peroxiredoxin [Ciceribacter naphthalenivorans]GLT03241.1 peroxiredoxin [Sphingomonas psychrolutea]
MADLVEGDVAPDFTLPRDGEGTISLIEMRGSPVVLYFYPKDDTSGCTTEALAFTALADAFAKAGAKVVGLSPDPVKKHDKFIAKHDLSVVLASDEEKATLSAYGVWKEKSMYGRSYMGVERTTFLIDSQGRIVKIWRKVKVAGHAEAVLQAVQAL